jgi:hypothetical protein
MDFLLELLKSTGWKMERQPLFGVFHLTYVFIGLFICVLAALFFKKHFKSKQKVILFCVWIILLLSEIYKQLFWYYVIEYDTYNWILFPFHLCSMPLYLLPFVIFLPEGRITNAIQTFLGSYCVAGGLVSVLVDGGLLREYWTLTLGCLNWHLILVFLGLYLGASGKLGRKWSDFLSATVVYAVLAVIAFAINLLMRNISNGQCDMFFIGPAKMQVVVYRDIANAVGRPLTSVLFLATLSTAAIVCWIITARIFPKHCKQQ